MRDPWTDRLSDYMDGEMPSEEEAECRAHLENCARCTRLLAELEAVKKWAASPPDLPLPGGDAWAEIRERIGRLHPQSVSTPSYRPSARLLRTAAILVLAAGTLLLWRILTPPGPQNAVPMAGQSSDLLSNTADQWREEFEARAALLDPASRQDIRRSLRMLEEFEGEIVGSLEEDPENRLLREFLRRNRRMQIQVLRFGTEQTMKPS